MSGSSSNNEGQSQSLNDGAAHDSGLYDPDRHDNQIVAVYESRTHAEAARDALLAAGVPQSAIQVLDKSAGDATAGGVTRAEDHVQDEGFWGTVKSLFAPDDDVNAYHHAIDRGHAMVMVTPTGAMDRHHVIEVLEGSGPIDFDAKLEEWRQTGYDYSGAPRGAASTGSSGTGYTAATGAAMGVAAGMANKADNVSAQPIRTPDATAAATDLTGTRADLASIPPATTAHTPTGNEDTIKVVEEHLRIGKREVAQGAVRVRSYVVERPVEEQVRLREERVTLERRPVDRAVTPGDAALFQERTIEARATSEEAVVQKEARVVEEIGIHKETAERTETVRDTVRETKVEVEDHTTPAGIGGMATTATPGATSSGTNSPRK